MNAEPCSFTNPDLPSYLFFLFPQPLVVDQYPLCKMGSGSYEHDLGWTLVSAQAAYANA